MLHQSTTHRDEIHAIGVRPEAFASLVLRATTLALAPCATQNAAFLEPFIEWSKTI